MIFNIRKVNFNDFYQEFWKNTNKILIFFGEQLSGKTNLNNFKKFYFKN